MTNKAGRLEKLMAEMTVIELDQQVEDWKKENFGTIERPDAFEAAVRDYERESDYEAGRQENL